MKIENKTVVFPMGFSLNNLEKVLNHTFKDSKFSVHNRRYTLKIGNAIRLKSLEEDTEFVNCRIFMEGSLFNGVIVPFSIADCFIRISE